MAILATVAVIETTNELDLTLSVTADGEVSAVLVEPSDKTGGIEYYEANV